MNGRILMLVGLVVGGCGGPAVNPCTSPEPQVVVIAKDHHLWLCDQGHAVAHYDVALGRSGTGKRAAGDRKTPLGTYPLGKARLSSRFGTFIPVAYPTASQRLQGFSGADVGIHGPDRRLRWAGRANTWFDWTAGCIALGTDENVRAVAWWVQTRNPGIVIR